MEDFKQVLVQFRWVRMGQKGRCMLTSLFLNYYIQKTFFSDL
jgi:hypothetical protein